MTKRKSSCCIGLRNRGKQMRKKARTMRTKTEMIDLLDLKQSQRTPRSSSTRKLIALIPSRRHRGGPQSLTVQHGSQRGRGRARRQASSLRPESSTTYIYPSANNITRHSQTITTSQTPTSTCVQPSTPKQTSSKNSHTSKREAEGFSRIRAQRTR